MMKPIPILSDVDVQRGLQDEEAGFGALRTPRGSLPLRNLAVHAQIDALLAQVTVTQTFVNVLDEALEATYIFPLPDRAAVTQFQMKVNGRVIEAVLEERAERGATTTRPCSRASVPPSRRRSGRAFSQCASAT